MTFNNDRSRNPNEPVRRSTPFGRSNVLPLIVAAAVAIALIALMLSRTATHRVDDTNAGPSVQTMTPAPSPTTEPRPTQAPQP
jgi:hypothetical protein